jgi:uncharacterized protein DUF6519/carboxypeptidase family protein
MPGDFSRVRYERSKHYCGVLMQQGRVQLDADWNEQGAIAHHRTETEAIDVIGRSGAPKGNAGFVIDVQADPTNLSISAGRLYVDGLMCELDSKATYTSQPDYPHPPHVKGSNAIDLADGTYIVYADAWKREISRREDPQIHEVALGQADTTTRQKTVCQVKLLQVDVAKDGPAVTCATPFTKWDELTGQGSGQMNARTQPAGPSAPCLLPPTAGYLRLENQLYRIQVHTGGSRAQATFKWSRDNASVESLIEKPDGETLSVADVGKDGTLGFAGGQWVEVVDDESELHAAPHKLTKITKVDPGSRQITVSPVPAISQDGVRRTLRRWDQKQGTSDGIPMSSADWIDLEDGIQIQFSDGTYRAGDYWLVPARTASGDIVWPFDVLSKKPLSQPPAGIDHHYCRLAIVQSIAGKLTVAPCADLPFPPLTAITADDVSYDPAKCGDLAKAGVTTVQEAIDRLCGGGSEPAIAITGVLLDDGQPLGNDILVPVSQLVPRGFRIVCDAPVSAESFGGLPAQPPGAYAPSTAAGKPTCTLTLDLPYPLGAEASLWNLKSPIGFQPIVLAGTVKVDGASIFWAPTGPTSEWLKNGLFQVLSMQEAADRVLARVRVAGNFIWRGDASGSAPIYLDGESFGVRLQTGRVDLRFPSGNGRKGGDFEMWFWLMPPAAGPKAPTIAVAVLNNLVTGTVTGTGGVPLAGVKVVLSGPTTGAALTDANGHFRFANLVPGNYVVTAQLDAGVAQTSITVEQT